MTSEALQELCEAGQRKLMAMDYLGAEAALADAERHAWAARDWDTLARLYMPLQEARRQRRQRCGEGLVALDLLAEGPDDRVDGRRITENYPHGQLLVAGWGSTAPARRVRELQSEHALFVEAFLGAIYPVGGTGGNGRRAVVIVPLDDADLPEPGRADSLDALMASLPVNSLVRWADELPRGSRRGTTATYAEVMGMWERLHAPFLAAADAEVDPVSKMEGYRRTIRVDYACELAHQKLSHVAKELGRQARENRGAAPQ
jgi:hypothetical protein